LRPHPEIFSELERKTPMGAPGGLVSASHRPSEVARTLDAFRTSVRWMKAEGDIAA